MSYTKVFSNDQSLNTLGEHSRPGEREDMSNRGLLASATKERTQEKLDDFIKSALIKHPQLIEDIKKVEEVMVLLPKKPKKVQYTIMTTSEV